jgi:hypothetical protein
MIDIGWHGETGDESLIMAIQYAYGMGEKNVQLSDGQFQENDQIEGNLQLNLKIPGFVMEPDDYLKGYVSIQGQVESVSNGKAKLIVITSSFKDLPSKINLFEHCEYHKIETLNVRFILMRQERNQ